MPEPSRSAVVQACSKVQRKGLPGRLNRRRREQAKVLRSLRSSASSTASTRNVGGATAIGNMPEQCAIRRKASDGNTSVNVLSAKCNPSIESLVRRLRFLMPAGNSKMLESICPQHSRLCSRVSNVMDGCKEPFTCSWEQICSLRCVSRRRRPNSQSNGRVKSYSTRPTLACGSSESDCSEVRSPRPLIGSWPCLKTGRAAESKVSPVAAARC
mmetsp:Transcript_2338/g.7001  ORF Transcript_2338/g.7001 Transcript_2338/m.7001 type:complete len:213 (+) Transcript_2338:888-1526(+)